MSDQPQPPAYRVETDRLVLRCWRPDDVKRLAEAITASVEHLKEWMPWAHEEPVPLDERLSQVRGFRAAFDDGRDFIYGIFDADESRVLGGTGLHTRRGEGIREIGYWIHAEHINKGLATEATAALTGVGFEIAGARRIEIRCDPANAASAAIPRKLGFQEEGVLRNAETDTEGNPRDTLIQSMIPGEYAESPAAEYDYRAFDALGREL